jgi:hypothetical protein
MEIKTDWLITLDEDHYISAHGESFKKLLQSPEKLETFHKAFSEVTRAMQPAACWVTFPIKKFLHEKIILSNGTRIGGGPVTTVIAGAEVLIVAVCTIGPKIDRLMDQSQQDKQFFKAFLVHEISAWAVDSLRQHMCLWIEDNAKKQGLRVSAPLSPGESVWSVKEQAVIFSLLDAERIGVTLNTAMVMYPSRSLSLIIGSGPNPMGLEGATNCDFCTIKDRCSYREKRTNIQPA